MDRRDIPPSHRVLLWSETAIKLLERIGIAAAILCILGLIGITCVDVVGRYVFDRALGWAYDAALVLMIGACFSSLSALQARFGNVAVQFFYFKMPWGTRRLALLVQILIGIFASFVIGWRNGLYSLEAARNGWIYGGFGFIPSWLPYGFISVGCLLLCLRLVQQLLQVVFADPAAEAMLENAGSEEVGV